jgi:hypothetical protein
MSDEARLPFFRLEAKPYKIPDDLARELAAIVIEWGGLENAVTVDLEQLRMFKAASDLADAIPGTFGMKLKLWRRNYATLFPTIKRYNDIAENIFSNARIVGIQRHRLIHGLWRPAEDDPNGFYILTAIDRRKDPAYFKADVRFLAAVHEDIKKLSNAVWSLNASRQLHAAQGLLRPQPGLSDEHPAHPPPTNEKP